MGIQTKPGYLYETRSGRQWLCLNEMPFAKTAVRRFKDKETAYPTSEIVYDGRYQYLRWSNFLETAMAGKHDLNSLIRILASTEKKRPWTQTGRFATRPGVLDLTKEIRQIIDPGLTTPGHVDAAPWTPHPALPDYEVFTRYQILTGEKKMEQHAKTENAGLKFLATAIRRTQLTRPEITDGKLAFVALPEGTRMEVQCTHETDATKAGETMLHEAVRGIMRNFPGVTVTFQGMSTIEMFDENGAAVPVMTFAWDKSLKCNIELNNVTDTQRTETVS